VGLAVVAMEAAAVVAIISGRSSTTTIFFVETRHQKGGENYIMNSSKTTSKKFIKSLTTNPNKIRKITLAILIIAVSLSVAIEIGYTTSLVQGYSTKADSA
jgi:hypothetical protein